MARAYSLDLRERVVAAVTAGQSCRSAAKTFMVSVASVVKSGGAEDGRAQALSCGPHCSIASRRPNAPTTSGIPDMLQPGQIVL
jgi:hypothetical protein